MKIRKYFRSRDLVALVLLAGLFAIEVGAIMISPAQQRLFVARQLAKKQQMQKNMQPLKTAAEIRQEQKEAFDYAAAQEIIAQKVKTLNPGEYFLYEDEAYKDGMVNGFVVPWDLLQRSNHMKGLIEDNGWEGGKVAIPIKAIPIPNYSFNMIKEVFNVLSWLETDPRQSGVLGQSFDRMPLDTLVQEVNLCDYLDISILFRLYFDEIVERILTIERQLFKVFNDYQDFWRMKNTFWFRMWFSSFVPQYPDYTALYHLTPGIGEKFFTYYANVNNVFIEGMYNLLRYKDIIATIPKDSFFGEIVAAYSTVLAFKRTPDAMPDISKFLLKEFDTVGALLDFIKAEVDYFIQQNKKPQKLPLKIIK